MGAILYTADEIFTVTFTLANVDANSKLQTRQKIFELDDSVTTHVAAATAADALAIDLLAITGADILHRTIGTAQRGLASGVTSLFDVYKEAVLTLNPADGSELITHTIPAPNNAIVAGKNVIESAAVLLAYLDNFEPTGAFNLSDGEFITAANQIASSRTRKVASGTSY
jgi:hypothetical protein